MSIKNEIIKGVFWSAVEKYSYTAVAIIISAVLARLVAPKDFGVMSIATVISEFLLLFTSMGIGPAIIQRDDLTQKNLNSIFTYSIICGLILSVILFFASYGIAHFYGYNDTLAFICKILCIQLFFAALNIVPNALMAKNKRFKEIAKRTLLLQIISGTLAIIAASQGVGIYALIITPIVTSIGIFLYNKRYYPCSIDFTLDIKPLKKIFSYSSYQFLFEFVNYFSRNLDKLIIGKCMNASDLGYYDKSYRLMMAPLQGISGVFNPVLQPILAYLQNDKVELTNKYNKITTFLSTISFPLAAFIFFSAGELINIVYGNNWDRAVPVFKILSISLPLQIILFTSGSIFKAGNATKYQFFTGLRNSFFTILGFMVSLLLFGTIEAIAWSWVITMHINFFFTYRTMYRKVLKSQFSRMLVGLRMPLLSCIVLSVVLFAYDALQIQNIYLSLVIKLLISMFVIYVNIQRNGQYDINKEIVSFINKYKKK